MVSCRSHPALGGTVGSEMAKSRTGLEAGARKFAGNGRDASDPRPRPCVPAVAAAVGQCLRRRCGVPSVVCCGSGRFRCVRLWTSCGGNHTRTVSTTCRNNSMRNVYFAHSCTGCRAHRLHPGVSRRSCVRFLLEPVQVQLGSLRYWNETSAVKDDGYLEPKDLDETVSELHFSALGAELTVPTQVTQASRSTTLPRVSTTVIKMQGSAEVPEMNSDTVAQGG